MKPITETLNHICGNKFFPAVFTIMAFVIVLFYSETTSPLYKIEFGDSSVFKMMGHVLLNGGVPYVDYFDHKGPYLYLINAIGEFISPVWGLFIIQIVWLSITMFLWFRIARLFVSPLVAFVVLLLTLVCFLNYYVYGNLTEEWSILPSSLCLYLSISYLIRPDKSPHEKWRSLVYGLCFGLIFFIRPNDAVIQCGGIMTGIFLYILFKQRQYANALLNALAFVLGFAVMATPWVAYFACHHALGDFYFGLIGFNLNYASGITGYNYTIRKVLYIFAIPILLLFETRQKVLFWLLVPIGLLALLFFGKNGFHHYYMTLIPAGYLILFILLFCLKLKPLIIIGVILIMFTQYQYDSVSRFENYVGRIVHNSYASGLTEYEIQWRKVNGHNEESLFDIVPKEEEDSIWNYDDDYSALFHHCGIIAQNPVPPIIANQKQHFPKEKLDILNISLYKPLWIFKKVDTRYVFSTDSAFIAEHYYVASKIDSSPYYLLKRKD